MSNRLVVFTLDAQRYALPLASVQQVVRVAEITPLPKAPEVVLGVIDLKGKIIPVMSMRKRFGLSEPEINLSDQIIMADIPTRSIGLVVTSVNGVVERTAEEVADAEKIVPGAQYVEGMTRLEDGILFIHNLDGFLSKKEDQQIEGLLDLAAGRG